MNTAIEWLRNNWLDAIELPAAALAAIAAVYTWVLSRNAALYANFDTLYQTVLDYGLTKPYLRDSSKTADYENRFSGDELLQYESYAYMVFNVCETIADGLDFYDKRPMGPLAWLEWLIYWAFPISADRKWLRKTWRPVLVAEKKLHGKWLERQTPDVRFKKEFLDLMKAI